MEFHQLDIRPMQDLGIIDASQLDANDLMRQLEEDVSRSQISGSIARLTVRDVPLPTYNALDFSAIKKLTAPALHFDLRFAKKEQVSEVQWSARSINTLANEFRSYIAQIVMDDFDKEQVLQTGLDYLESAASTLEEA